MSHRNFNVPWEDSEFSFEDDEVLTPRLHELANFRTLKRQSDQEPLIVRLPAFDEEVEEASASIPGAPPLPNVNRHRLSTPPIVDVEAEDWSLDHTPLPVAADLGSLGPTAVDQPPWSGVPMDAPPTHTGWKIATASLAGALAMAAILWFAPLDAATQDATQSLESAAGAPQPHFSIDDFPVVNFVEEQEEIAEPIELDEVSIFAVAATEDREERSRRDRIVGENDARSAKFSEPAGGFGMSLLHSDEAEAKEASKPAQLPPFDRGAAAAALDAAASAATSCHTLDDSAGLARLSVTFAPNGRVNTATVSGRFAGTQVGGCIARTFRDARIEPFDGGLVTVHKTVSIR